MRITVISKAPPGGRCTLYLGYARTLAACFRAEVEVLHPAPQADLQPPAMLVDGQPISPADGVLLSPEDIHRGIAKIGLLMTDHPDLLERLEALDAEFMNECEA